jgi:ATP-dependent Zn protease
MLRARRSRAVPSERALRSTGRLRVKVFRIGPGTSPTRRRLIAAAVHEAGHAVAAYHTGVRFRRIAIGKSTGKELGWLELWLTPQSPADAAVDVRTEHAIERCIIVLLAGSHAERIVLGRAKYLGSGLDFFEAVRYAGSLCRTRREMSAYLRWMQLRVHALVESPTWHRPIEALAARLVERQQLGVREARSIIRRAIPMSREAAELAHEKPRVRT